MQSLSPSHLEWTEPLDVHYRIQGLCFFGRKDVSGTPAPSCSVSDCGVRVEFQVSTQTSPEDIDYLCSGHADELYFWWPMASSDMPKWIVDMVEWPKISISRFSATA